MLFLLTKADMNSLVRQNWQFRTVVRTSYPMLGFYRWSTVRTQTLPPLSGRAPCMHRQTMMTPMRRRTPDYRPVYLTFCHLSFRPLPQMYCARQIGSFRSRDDMQLWLNDWVMNYVDGDPSISTEATKANARWPLRKFKLKT